MTFSDSQTTNSNRSPISGSAGFLCRAARNIPHKTIDFVLRDKLIVSCGNYGNQLTVTMTKSTAQRKKRFVAALVTAGLTAEAWAKQNGVTGGHLSQVLSGRKSVPLESKIDAFATRWLARIKEVA